MASTTFFIPDTSPSLAYSEGWVPAYHPLGNGYDQTFHQTRNGGTVSFNITDPVRFRMSVSQAYHLASSLRFSTPYSEAPDSRCDVQYRLNGSDWTDGCQVDKLPKGLHGVTIRPKGDRMQFFGIGGEMRLTTGGKHHNTTIDNLSSSFTFTPADSWTQVNSAGPFGSVSNQTAANVFGDKAGFSNQSLGLTTVGGAKAELRFKGEAVYLYGLSGPDGGLGQIMLDGNIISYLNMTLPWRGYSSLLFSMGDLDGTTEHTLSFTNLSPGQLAVIDYAVVTVAGSDENSPNLGLILGSVAGGVAMLLLIGIASYCCITRRRSRPRNNASYPSYPGSATYSEAPKSQADIWRKNSVGSPISPVSIAFSDHPSQASKSTTQLVQMHKTPPPVYGSPEFPDYIPYRGPIEPKGDIRRDDHPTPPDIVGGSPSAASWLAQAGHAPNAGTVATSSGRNLTSPLSTRSAQSYAGSGRNGSSPVRPPPPARYPSKESVLSYDPIAAYDYFSGPPLRREPGTAGRDTLISPADVPSTATEMFSLPTATAPATHMRLMRESLQPPSSAGSTGSARDATIFTATMGRLWPSRSTVPSMYINPSASLGTVAENTPNHSQQSNYGSTATYRSPVDSDRDARGPSTGYLPRISTAESTMSDIFMPYTGPTAYNRPYSASSSADRHHSRAPSAVPSSAALTAPPTSSLRRGVSIKSVKTVRSFFSTFMAGGDVPAVPTHHQGSARPDSDLFGDSVSVSRRSSVNEVSGSVVRETGSQGGRNAPHPLRLLRGSNTSPRNLFIELTPNSPMTVVSRPGSQQPGW